MKKSFEIIAHAKWILVGEHAVLRGHPALVFPVPDKYIKLTFEGTAHPLDADCFGDYSDTLLLIFWGVLEEGLKLVNKKHGELSGRFTLHNTIPMGAGLGFSAALCVALSQWFLWNEWIKKEDLFEVSRQLETYFHGKSSGVDIAGALCDQATHFENGRITPFSLTWRPAIYLSHSDKISLTAKCIDEVSRLWKTSPALAKSIDQAMHDSVHEAKQALTQDVVGKNPPAALTALTQAIQKANQCFEQWGLNKGELQDHLKTLSQHGALAAKCTGAGNGGYVISLWETSPPETLPFELLRII